MLTQLVEWVELVFVMQWCGWHRCGVHKMHARARDRAMQGQMLADECPQTGRTFQQNPHVKTRTRLQCQLRCGSELHISRNVSFIPSDLIESPTALLLLTNKQQKVWLF